MLILVSISFHTKKTLASDKKEVGVFCIFRISTKQLVLSTLGD